MWRQLSSLASLSLPACGLTGVGWWDMEPSVSPLGGGDGGWFKRRVWLLGPGPPRHCGPPLSPRPLTLPFPPLWLRVLFTSLSIICILTRCVGNSSAEMGQNFCCGAEPVSWGGDRWMVPQGVQPSCFGADSDQSACLSCWMWEHPGGRCSQSNTPKRTLGHI